MRGLLKKVYVKGNLTWEILLREVYLYWDQVGINASGRNYLHFWFIVLISNVS
jgi:hypothetical protein